VSVVPVAVRRHPVLAGLVVALIVLGCGLVYTTIRPTTYTATSVFTLGPRDAVNTPADTVELVARSYRAYMSSPDVLAEVSRSTGTPLSASADEVEVQVPPGTANLQTEVTLTSADRAAAVADAINAAGVAKAGRDALVAPDLVSPADPAAATTHPRRLLLVAGSVLAAILAGSLVLYVLGHRYEHERVGRRLDEVEA
jgi:capsular polysaccharide biosynthesis protein